MSVVDKDALICDFAQYYSIYQFDKYEISYIAILACGLPEESRIKKKLRKIPYTLEETLLAAIVDHLAMQLYQHAGKKSNRKPKSLLRMMMEKEDKSAVQSFNTVEAFESARRKIIEG